MKVLPAVLIVCFALLWPSAVGAAEVGDAHAVGNGVARVHLTATEKTKTWVSERRFSSRRGFTAIAVDVYSRGRWIGSAWRDSCVGFGYAPGFAFRLSTCGDPTPVRIRFRSFQRDVPFTLVFRGLRD
jgi:hypothetical protein